MHKFLIIIIFKFCLSLLFFWGWWLLFLNWIHFLGFLFGFVWWDSFDLSFASIPLRWRCTSWQQLIIILYLIICFNFLIDTLVQISYFDPTLKWWTIIIFLSWHSSLFLRWWFCTFWPLRILVIIFQVNFWRVFFIDWVRIDIDRNFSSNVLGVFIFI